MQFQFDARQHEPFTGGYEMVPAGTYPVMARKSNIKATADNSGGYLQFDWEILDGPFKGKIIFDRLNLFNNNQQAVNIANQRLSAICHACNVYNISATDAPDNAAPMLHNIPLAIRVTVKSSPVNKNEPAGEKRENNNVDEYLDRNGQKLTKGGAASQPQPQQPSFAPQGQQPQFGAQPGAAPAGAPQGGGFQPPAQAQPGAAPATGPGWQTGGPAAAPAAVNAPQQQAGAWPGQQPQPQPGTGPGPMPGAQPSAAPEQPAGWQGGAGANMPWAR